MTESLFSSRWYRVAELHPRLRPHVRVSRHVYRDDAWYLLQDTTTGRHHRVDEAAFHFIGRMDGQRTVQEIWHTLMGALGEKAPTQDETIEILCQLNDNALLQCEITPDIAELFRRRGEHRRKRLWNAINPLAFKVPLFDPDRLLTRMAPVARVLFHPLALVPWSLVVMMGLISALTNWDEIRAYAGIHTRTPGFLLLLWACYPVIKAVHELGHGLAVKAWGGDVRELGISVLVLVPVPYVDASAASAFPEKHRRMAVGAAGIMVELFLAALGMYVWTHVSDGTLREIGFVFMLVGGVSTLLFNGNPLLRFDGYFVLSDALDVPNLGPRSAGYVRYLAQRRLLGLTSAQNPVTARGETPLLFGYAIASFVYRWLVSVLIVLWLADYSFWLGVLGGVSVFALMVVRPIVAMVRFLLNAPQLDRGRARGLAIAGGVAAFVLVVVGVVPLSQSTNAQGVVWLPEQARVRAGTDGFVAELLAKDGQPVRKGQTLVVLSDPGLNAEEAKVRARLAALEVEYNQAYANGSSRVTSIQEDMQATREELVRIGERLDSLQVTAGADGTLVMPRAQDLPDSYVAKGTVLAHVLAPEDIGVKVAVPQVDAGLVRGDTKSVEVRLVERAGEVVKASLAGEVPAATSQLPTAALGDRGGGALVTDPLDKDGTKLLEPVFLFDLKVSARSLERVGARVWVRFDHGSRPLVAQWYRRFQQLFLKHFDAQR